MNCPCGRKATHRIEVERPSLRGVAYGWERYCARCADRRARDLLASGAVQAHAEALPEGRTR